MQALQLNPSNGEFSDNEEYEAVNAAEAVAELEAKSSESENEKTVAIIPRPFGSEENMGQSADNTNEDAPQPIQSKDGSLLILATTSQCVQGGLQQQSIINFRSGPTSYVAHRIQQNSIISSFRIFILYYASMLRHIRKCTITEDQRAIGNDKGSVSLDELEKFIGLVVARGVTGNHTLPIKSMWSATWGFNLFNKTMPRDRSLEIMKYLQFNLKSKRRQNLLQDIFCLASSL